MFNLKVVRSSDKYAWVQRQLPQIHVSYEKIRLLTTVCTYRLKPFTLFVVVTLV